MVVSRRHIWKCFSFKRPLSVQSLHRNNSALLVAVIHERLGSRSLTHYVLTAGRIMATNWKILRRRRRLGKNSMAHSSWNFPVAMPTLVSAWFIRNGGRSYVCFVSIDVWRSRLFNQWHISYYIPHDKKTLGATTTTTVAVSYTETDRRIVDFYDHRYCSRFHVWNSPTFLLSSTSVLRARVVVDRIKPACLWR